MSGVLVDTSIWFLALRRKNPRQVRVTQRLTQLIDDNQVKDNWRDPPRVVIWLFR
jgi:hypothetical protein